MSVSDNESSGESENNVPQQQQPPPPQEPPPQQPPPQQLPANAPGEQVPIVIDQRHPILSHLLSGPPIAPIAPLFAPLDAPLVAPLDAPIVPPIVPPSVSPILELFEIIIANKPRVSVPTGPTEPARPNRSPAPCIEILRMLLNSPLDQPLPVPSGHLILQDLANTSSHREETLDLIGRETLDIIGRGTSYPKLRELLSNEPYIVVRKTEEQDLNLNPSKPDQIYYKDSRDFNNHNWEENKNQKRKENDEKYEDEDEDENPMVEMRPPTQHNALLGEQSQEENVWRIMKDSRPNEINTRQFLFNNEQLEHITVKTVQKLMKYNVKNIKKMKVVKLLKNQLVPAGENYNSILCTIDVIYHCGLPKPPILLSFRESHYERCLVAKVLPDGFFMEKHRKLGIRMASDHFRPSPRELYLHFDRERLFYERFWPKLARLIGVNKKYNHREYIVPRYYRKSPRYCLYFDNLEKNRSYRLFRHQGANLNHCKVAFRTLAQLHAASIALLNKGSYLKDQFPSNIVQIMDINKLPFYIYTNLFRCLAKEMRNWAGFKNLGTKLLGETTKIFDKVTQVRASNFGSLKVFLHGDFWSGSILFRKSLRKKERPQKFGRLVDFQCCQWGTPAIDLVHFLYISAQKEILFEHEEEMYTFYYKKMKKLLRENYGLDPKVVFPRKKLKADLKNCKLYALINGITLRWVTRAPFNEQADFSCLLKDQDQIPRFDHYWIRVLNNDTELLNTIQSLLSKNKHLFDFKNL